MNNIRNLLWDIKEDLRTRLAMAVLFAALFFICGYYLPKMYYQYLDTKNYISFSNPITFNKKVFQAGETMTAIVRWHSAVNSNIHAQTRLLRVDAKVFTPIKSYDTRTFSGITPQDGVLYRIMFTLPKDIKPGFYVFDGVYSYWIKGVHRTYSFVTTQIEIREPRLSPTPTPFIEDVSEQPVAGTSAQMSVTITETPQQTTQQATNSSVPQQNTIIFTPSNTQTSEQPTQAPQPTPTPQTGVKVCLPVLGCVIK